VELRKEMFGKTPQNLISLWYAPVQSRVAKW